MENRSDYRESYESEYNVFIDPELAGAGDWMADQCVAMRDVETRQVIHDASLKRER